MSSSNEKMSVEDGTEELDALEKFQSLYGDLGETVMETTGLPQANEEDRVAPNTSNRSL
jgi:hypothetical protein